MTNKTFLLISAIFFCLSNTLAQGTSFDIRRYSCVQIQKANDIEGALRAGKAQEVKLTCPPKGTGVKKEAASGRAVDKYYFEDEHNITWIKFRAKWDGHLNLRIEPDSLKDDYDFLLFKSTGENFESKLSNRSVKPIRSNIARNKEGQKGVTGLNYLATKAFIHSGPNEQFSSSPDVKANDEFYLAIDNVYENGGGATIYFDYMKKKEIQGVVKDEQNNIVPDAEITWENTKTGEVINSTVSDAEGNFSMVVLYDMNPKNEYSLTSFSNNHFFAEKAFTPIQIHKCSPEPISIVLPELKKGVRGTVSNIHFMGGSPKFLSSAYPSLKRLKKLMKKNKSLNILIEGHTNGCQGGVRDSQELSENRAAAVGEYLEDAGIKTSRLSTIGKNCTEMLYPVDSSPAQQKMNRRVEILVTDY